MGRTPETDIEKKVFGGFLPDLYNDPTLYAAYPQLRQKPFQVVDRSVLGNSWGENPRVGSMKLRADIAHKDLAEGKKLFLHETKHEIENIEDWPKGGQPQYTTELLEPAELQQVLQVLKNKKVPVPTNMSGQIGFNNMKKALEDYSVKHGTSDLDYGQLYNIAAALRDKQKASNAAAFKGYQDLHGEAMARLVPYRMNLNPNEIRQQYPFDPDYFNKATGSDINDLRVTY